MASQVQICNLALSHIGDVAAVSSIDPPDGSGQAAYCAQFYGPALNAFLEMAAWSFASERIAAAQVDNPSTTWLYAYAMPSGVVNALAVLPSDALDDYSQNVGQIEPSLLGIYRTSNPAANLYTPQPYVMETGADGNCIILTNVPNAVFRYTVLVSDPTQFSPLFTMAFSYLLASMLAGPIIKGDAGAGKSAQMLQMFQSFKSQAVTSDANQRRIELRQAVPWMVNR